MNPADPALVRLRDDYRRLNQSFEASLVFRFGRGGGFCAEMLRLIKSMMFCLDRGIRLCMGRGGRPAGIGIVEGFTDYFEPLFPEVDAGMFNALNLQTVRGSGRFPIIRRGVSRLLGAVTGGDYFMMDELDALPARLVVPKLGIDAEYADACALLVRLMWTYRPDVGQEVRQTLAQWDLAEPYVSVHVRRGDKDLESPHVPLDRYVAAIGNVRPEGCAVAIASDDAAASNELAALLPARFRAVRCSTADGQGFRRDEFNRLPAAERYRHVKRFLAELEVLRGGSPFVGSAGSNVTYFIEMMKAGREVLRVQTE